MQTTQTSPAVHPVPDTEYSSQAPQAEALLSIIRIEVGTGLRFLLARKLDNGSVGSALEECIRRIATSLQAGESGMANLPALSRSVVTGVMDEYLAAGFARADAHSPSHTAAAGAVLKSLKPPDVDLLRALYVAGRHETDAARECDTSVDHIHLLKGRVMRSHTALLNSSVTPPA